MAEDKINDRDNNKAICHGQSHPIPGPGSQVLVAPV